jgi:hypothetical protein
MGNVVVEGPSIRLTGDARIVETYLGLRR